MQEMCRRAQREGTPDGKGRRAASLLCHVLTEPFDGTLGIAGEFDVFLTTRRKKLNAQTVSISLHILIVATDLRSKHNDVVLVHDCGVLAIPTGRGWPASDRPVALD